MSGLGQSVGRAISTQHEYDPRYVVAQTEEAAARIAQFMEPVPTNLMPIYSEVLGVPTYANRNDITPVGSFKMRGAGNLILQLSSAELNRGVIAASAGNHAQGVAKSASIKGVETTIVMPTRTPETKIDAVRRMGAEVILYGDDFDSAYKYSLGLQSETGATYVHPFDDWRVIAGQGTVALELLKECPDVTDIFTPVGGGGLYGGVSRYVNAIRPDIRVWGVEQSESNAMEQSLAIGEPKVLDRVGTFAEGTAVRRVGDITFGLAQKYGAGILTVTTDEICAAAVSFIEETHSILEPAGALGLAGVSKFVERSGGTVPKGSVFAAICSGSNVDTRRLRVMLERGKFGSNNEALFSITLPEQPGALLRLCEEVVNGHNITEFSYRLNKRDEAHILVGFGISGPADKKRFLEKLNQNQYSSVDYSDDEFARNHLTSLVGGSSNEAENEYLYEIEFPEHPGALIDLLRALQGNWNISLFHYRGEGGDLARVAIGFEASDIKALEKSLAAATTSFRNVKPDISAKFLQTRLAA